MKYIRVFDGRLIEYSDCGDNNGDILLNIHGFGMTGKYYQDVSFHCEFAESRGLRLISPSMPCFGRSDCYPMNISRKLRFENFVYISLWLFLMLVVLLQ